MTSVSNSLASPAEASRTRLRNLRNSLGSQEVVLAITLIVGVLVIGLINPRFLAPRNLLGNILLNSSYIAVAAIGMTMVIISGNIDISVGPLIGALAILCGTLATHDVPLWLSFSIPLIVGALFEAVIGILVAYFRIPAIVASLGMYSIIQGGLILTTGGYWIYNLPEGFGISQEYFLGIPVPVYFMVILTIVAAYWMRNSPQGREIYAVGGNVEAARLSGINTRAVIMRVFIINGFMCGIAGVLFATQNSSIQSSAPAGLELTIITSSVIGGVSILGGVGTVIGSTLGAILLPTIGSALVFISVSPYWTQAVQGILILVTVLVDLLRRRRLSLRGA
jgi:ribose/xylose/arabinose/galactoside ABC-type transport system permease subunit